MSKWSEFYRTKMFDNKKQASFLKKYEPYLLCLKQNLTPTTYEWGCGTGIVSGILDFMGTRTVLMDNDEDVLNLVKLRLLEYGYRREPIILKHDIRNPIPFAARNTLSHSHGVLEHFSLRDCRRIIANMRDCSKTVISYVPTDRYICKSFGDECLMPTSKWKKLFSPTETIEFNDGKDLILIWRS